MKIKTGILPLNSLRFRIMLPAVVFIFIFSLFFIVLNNHYTSKLLDKRLEREAVRISKIVYESKFVLNPVYLKRLGEVIEGRIAVFDTSGKVLAASFDAAGTADFLSFVNPLEIQKRHASDRQEQVVIKINKADNAFLLVLRQLIFSDTNRHILIAILTPLDDLESAKSQTALRTILSGFVALILAFIAAGLVLKKITVSVKDILSVTKKIASGDFSCKAALSDISELKTLASSINQMSDKLVDYEKKLVDSTRLMSANKITAAMAHEIKNPLSSMKMLAQMIQKRFENDREGFQMTAAFIKEINRVDTLVSDLRTLSGPAKFSFSMVHPLLPLEEVIEIITPKLDHLSIRLSIHADADIPEILMDKDKIKQVLWNLMMNGVQSMPNGGKLEVFLQKSERHGFIEYRIKDWGAGIKPTEMDLIFTPFFTTKKEGIGIGLSVSKEIARAHKGEINIIPNEKGTSVHFSIPCHTEWQKGAV